MLGCDPLRRAVEVLAEVGYVAQGAPLYRSFTVADTIEFARRTNPRWDDEIVAELLTRIDSRTKVGALSAGERARLALALVLGKRPQLLLLDEPFAGLDPLAGREFLQLLMDGVAETSATVVIASHVIADIERVCDHIVLLTGGSVRLEGNVEAAARLAPHPDGPAPAARRDPRRARDRARAPQRPPADAARARRRPDRRSVLDGRARRPRGAAARLHGAGAPAHASSPRRGSRCDGMGDVAPAPGAARRRARPARRCSRLAAVGTHLPIADAYHRDALSGCLPPSARSGCDIIVRHFESEFDSWAAAVRGLAVLPALAGLFVGAPLLARELEHGTHRFAWTQGDHPPALAALEDGAARRRRRSSAARRERARDVVAQPVRHARGADERRAASTSRVSSSRPTRCSRSRSACSPACCSAAPSRR